jgi:hypothetical protein
VSCSYYISRCKWDIVGVCGLVVSLVFSGLSAFGNVGGAHLQHNRGVRHMLGIYRPTSAPKGEPSEACYGAARGVSVRARVVLRDSRICSIFQPALPCRAFTYRRFAAGVLVVLAPPLALNGSSHAVSGSRALSKRSASPFQNEHRTHDALGISFDHCPGANFRVRVVSTETGRPFML